MKLKIFLFLISANFIFSQGLKITENKDFINNIKPYSKVDLGFAAELPVRYDLKKYVPPIGNQKNSGSCVAWSISYYGMSIIYNQAYQITDPEGQWANRFDPWFIYNQLSYQNPDTCEDGIKWEDAFSLASRVGNKKLTLPPYDLDCSKDWSIDDIRNISAVTKQYRISNYEYLETGRDDYKTIDQIKLEIYKYNFPVIIGVYDYGDGLSKAGETGYFEPNYTDQDVGHAMTIVGYDDFVNGGSFLVVNSWGEDWGKDGYMWMKYDDFNEFVYYAFTIYVPFNKLEELESNTFTRRSWDDGNQIYEGQISVSDRGWIENGYGINYNINTKKYEIGKWIGGKKDGKFYIVENLKWRTESYENGNQVFGFASSEDEQLEKYVQTLFKDEEISFMN